MKYGCIPAKICHMPRPSLCGRFCDNTELSGATSVVAKKLGRNYVGIEIDEQYGCLAEKRLEMADTDKTIQGYSDGAFWERNTPNGKLNGNGKNRKADDKNTAPLSDERLL